MEFLSTRSQKPILHLAPLDLWSYLSWKSIKKCASLNKRKSSHQMAKTSSGWKTRAVFLSIMESFLYINMPNPFFKHVLTVHFDLPFNMFKVASRCSPNSNVLEHCVKMDSGPSCVLREVQKSHNTGLRVKTSQA